ncbi:NAD-dependent epimerase/dehydratase family protein [Erythrobacter litoralis]|uniref:NAD-dependent epimerase/dehydratase family protein n=1 Tax=Erythrobacter litoralis TaxID=39960 RepID=UPI002435DA55|nr:NAD-dependent epimerase/dehydratase family protein [Erythrobacter litoralis]
MEPAVAEQLRADDRRIVIVGAGGWIGRVLLSGLYYALGKEQFSQRVRCFGSVARPISFGTGLAVSQAPLSDARSLAPEATILFHLAFLTKDKVARMDEDAYVSANRKLSEDVLDVMSTIGVDRLFYASSGAAAFAEDEGAASDLCLYGKLKRADEVRFANWAEEDARSRRAVITRIYSVSGPFINKHDTYALADFIRSSLSGEEISVTAPMPVYRSFVAIRELLSLILAQLLRDDGPSTWAYDSGGDPVELAGVAKEVVWVLGGSVRKRHITRQDSNLYYGDDGEYQKLLSKFAITSVPLRQQVAETAIGFGEEWS